MIYTSEKMIKDAGDKITDEERKSVEEKIEALKEIKDGDDHEAIKKAADELTEAAQKVGAKMYEQDKATQENTQQPASEEEKDETVVDAEFEEKKEEEETKE